MVKDLSRAELYQALEQRVREIAPVSTYGYRGYIVSPEYWLNYKPKEKKALITGDFSNGVCFDLGYDCQDISELVWRLARDLGLELSIVKGRDERSLFKEHYFCLDTNGIVIDGTPLYPFIGARHLEAHPDIVEIVPPRAKITTLSSNSALKLEDTQSTKYLIALNFELAGKTANKELRFVIVIEEIFTKEWIDFEFNLNPQAYQEHENQSYAGYSKGAEEAMQHYQALRQREILRLDELIALKGSAMFDSFYRILQQNFDIVDAVAHKLSFQKSF